MLTASSSINPTFEQRKRSRLDLIVAGSKDGIVMVEAGAKEVTEEEMVQALDRAHAAIKDIVAGIDALAQQAGKKKLAVTKKEIGKEFYREVEEKVLVPLADAMRIQDKLENYGTVDQVLANLIASIPEDEVERKVEAKAIFKELKEKVLRDEILERGKRLDGRAFDQIRHDHHRGRRPAAHARLGGVHARRDAGAGHRHARHRRRSAEGRDGRRRDVEALHAPLQLPAVLGRRSGVHARPRPPRNRPRRSRRARAGADDADRREVPLHRPRRLRHPRIERLVVDGVGLRRLAGDDGCRRAAEGAGRRRGDGPGDERGERQVRRPLATSPAPKITTATWTSRSPARPRASPPCRWTSRSPASRWRSCARRSSRRARDGCSSWARCRRRWRSRAPNVSQHAPRIVTIRIPVDKIRDVIGPGGKMIRSIIERTGVKIDVEDDGRVNVASADEASAAKAIGIIQELTATPELNKTYMGKVQRITDFGAFVEIMPGLDGLLHVSEIAHYRVKDVRDELKEGDQVMVKVINIDPSGKIRLSRKALLVPEEGQAKATREGRRSPIRRQGRRTKGAAAASYPNRWPPSVLSAVRARGPASLGRPNDHLLHRAVLGVAVRRAACCSGAVLVRPPRPRAQGADARVHRSTGDQFAFSPGRASRCRRTICEDHLHREGHRAQLHHRQYRIAKRAGAGQSVTFEFRADQPGTLPLLLQPHDRRALQAMEGELIVR